MYKVTPKGSLSVSLVTYPHTRIVFACYEGVGVSPDPEPAWESLNQNKALPWRAGGWGRGIYANLSHQVCSTC